MQNADFRLQIDRSLRSICILQFAFCNLHFAFESGVRGRIHTCDLHLRKVARYLLRYADNCVERKLASVIGLAPIRVGLKIRLRELLCIHGLLSAELRSVSCELRFGNVPHSALSTLNSQLSTLHLKSVPAVGIAPTS